jgi:hypothetical protein
MLAHVQALAGEIGPRGTGTPAEAAAADYVCTQLTSLKLPIERRSFRAVSSQNAFPVAVNLLGLLAVVVYPLGGALFYLSDVGIAWNLFVRPLPGDRLLTMVAYHLAQFALTHGAFLAL